MTDLIGTNSGQTAPQPGPGIRHRDAGEHDQNQKSYGSNVPVPIHFRPPHNGISSTIRKARIGFVLGSATIAAWVRGRRE